MARKHVLQTTGLFLIAYAVAPWASNMIIQHFAEQSAYTHSVEKNPSNTQLSVTSQVELP